MTTRMFFRFRLLLLAAPLSAACLNVSAQTAPGAPPRPHTVAVRGTAFQEVEPEWVELLVTYRVSDNVKDSDKAKEQEKALRNVLPSFNIAPEKLMLDNLTAYGYGGFSKMGNSTVALTRVYRLRLDKPAVLNELIPRLVQTGADNVQVARLENAQLEARRQEVLGKALDNARQKAALLARQLGQQLGAPLAVTEVTPFAGYRLEETGYKRKEGYQREIDAADAPVPNLRTIRVTSTVDAEFELK
ncbi:SIMPL domain-containing protein [Hymenobacter jeollabukensis]|uniref:SIMPL domain-containing protein n=1 Tax=Hymenobacter jeollabukensis TaxID=2025313 RepID=A0A5R8WPR1_9BACT|nr:SIMPL domain-containing protein [Hymenobacter jeollabukensis]TLM92287.1 SIMPL domain-containing protein [Hymenobacter jeollabukensis]